MNGYTKLFSSIITSTIWQEDLATKVVWITLLAMSDRDGFVEGTIPGLAHLAGVTPDQAEHALEIFQRPDKYSRTPDHEGRRVEAIDGGWLILNRTKYRDLIPEEHRRERDRDRQRRHRQKTQDGGLSRVTECDSHEMSHQKETETKTEKNIKACARPTVEQVSAYCKERGNAVDPQQWFDHYEANGWKVGRNPMRDWKAAVRTWEKNQATGWGNQPQQAREDTCSDPEHKGLTNEGRCWTCRKFKARSSDGDSADSREATWRN